MIVIIRGSLIKSPNFPMGHSYGVGGVGGVVAIASIYKSHVYVKIMVSMPVTIQIATRYHIPIGTIIYFSSISRDVKRSLLGGVVVLALSLC